MNSVCWGWKAPRIICCKLQSTFNDAVAFTKGNKIIHLPLIHLELKTTHVSDGLGENDSCRYKGVNSPMWHEERIIDSEVEISPAMKRLHSPSNIVLPFSKTVHGVVWSSHVKWLEGSDPSGMKGRPHIYSSSLVMSFSASLMFWILALLRSTNSGTTCTSLRAHQGSDSCDSLKIISRFSRKVPIAFLQVPIKHRWIQSSQLSLSSFTWRFLCFSRASWIGKMCWPMFERETIIDMHSRFRSCRSAAFLIYLSICTTSGRENEDVCIVLACSPPLLPFD